MSISALCQKRTSPWALSRPSAEKGLEQPYADLPILTRSTLSNLAAKKEDAVDEAKQKIDRILARLNYPYAK
ncbi:MAG: hypothetical protein WB713_12860 [Methyloceanibacter sp.]